MSLTIAVKRLAHGEGLPLPRYETPGAAGLDLMAANGEDDPIILEPNGRALVPTGLVIQIPKGYEGQVRPRSGLALRHGVTVLNAPGTIDADFRGEVQVVLVNCGRDPFVVTRGMRIAQLVVAPVTTAILVEQDRLDETARAGSGFGSTGAEALFTLGDKPELRYQAARDALKTLGHDTTISYFTAMCALVLRETGLLPHANPGVMTREEIAGLREVTASQGIMLESTSERLCRQGGVHYGSPDKHPAVRLETLRLAGELKVPFTTGILIGIGETRDERIDALEAIRICTPLMVISRKSSFRTSGPSPTPSSPIPRSPISTTCFGRLRPRASFSGPT